MVVQPLSKTPVDKQALQAQLRQQEMGLARQYSFRAFSGFLQSLKIEDNRARFF